MDNIATVIVEMEDCLLHDARLPGIGESFVLTVDELQMERWVALLKEAKKED